MFDSKKTFVVFSIGVLSFAVLFIIFLATGVWKRLIYPGAGEDVRTRVVTPVEAGAIPGTGQAGQASLSENISTKLPMKNGEIVIAVLNRESEEGLAEEQFALYRNSTDVEGIVHITFFSYDEASRSYKRTWDATTAAVRPETISFYSQDLIGDRNNCIVVTGMNAKNEQTMTVFRHTTSRRAQEVYKKIAELQIEGSIVVQETGRTIAYQQGITKGQSFNIASYGPDSTSNNILDQIETIYSFNASNELYEQTRVSRIPGSQVEQRRLRELLSGAPGVFENFINDLWYFVSPQGTVDAKQYIYFDPGREIIFYVDEAQQVYQWQNSTPTRLGLHITSQNTSISTLRRRVDIELEAIDRIRLRVSDDVRLRIAVNESWDGSYRRASSGGTKDPVTQISPAINALYDSSWGRLQFNSSGEYLINSSGAVRRGRYVFYKIDKNELLELRQEGSENGTRMVYRIEAVGGSLILSRVRVGSSSIQDMLEPPITLTPVN